MHSETMSPEIGQIALALSEIHGEVSTIHKGADNPYFNSKYATLAAVRQMVNPLLHKHGLALTQLPTRDVVVSLLVHKSGQWIKAETEIVNAKGGPQGMGSAITYACRYAITAMLGIAPDEDDDGNLAQNHKEPPKAKAPAPSKAPAKAPAPDPDLDDKVEKILAALLDFDSLAEFEAYVRKHGPEWRTYPDDQVWKISNTSQKRRLVLQDIEAQKGRAAA
jgi:hypothetical protein